MGTDPLALAQAVALGTRLLTEFGLTAKGWTFELDTSKSRLGQCRPSSKEIGLSVYFLNGNYEETIRHEIAHALIEEDYDFNTRHIPDHGKLWQEYAIRCGATPRALAHPSVKSTAAYNFVMICPTCDRKWHRYRMRQRNYGGKCPDCKAIVTIIDLRTNEVLYG